ncbi:alanine--tRNA ligase [bacterium]|nr:alanine--tRNA ligase [bacterium]NBX82018.1 alanine--tRNA ligase [bacterium]
MFMKSSEIREKFLKYFEKHGHQRVKSSSLIPAADPTLLFTNAGMVQFKDVFLGISQPGYHRATTAQKCVRAGGKHNDLENVGFTPRHHTFFEMMGNFSFGDYFKKEAIHFAWNFLTEELKIPKEKLRITVYQEDQEALELWKQLGIRADWIEKLGEKDNFWAMGDTGPCGPCTEIHYDWGESYGKANSPGTDTAGKRFLEIWNLVFMQFNRDISGKLEPLPKPSVDTGAGLERLSAVLQNTYSNYDTDLFQPIIQKIAQQVGIPYGKDSNMDVAMRVIADHLRSSAFLMADGVIPSNEGRGYVLRRILRRAIRYGKKLGQEQPFIFKCVPSVIEVLGSVYPEVEKNRKLVETLLREEEERFHETLHRGLGVLEEALNSSQLKKHQVLTGETAFLLYDSYGFPLDLVEVICREHGISVDIQGFEARMEKQRAQSSKERGSDKELQEKLFKQTEKISKPHVFTGYEQLAHEGKLLVLCNAVGDPVTELKGEGYAVFDRSPFYAESGGQVGDRGKITGPNVEASVESTTKVGQQTVLHLKSVHGVLKLGSDYSLSVDPHLRRLTMRNHTATHLLHATLRKKLGDRVKQAGSLVDPERLRFDFTFPKALSEVELKLIEETVNSHVFSAAPVTVREMAYDEAVKQGALAFFDEKYGAEVRVVRVGDAKNPISVELCGGTHLSEISEIGYFKITTESSVASGVRRIEAVTSEKAFEYLARREELFSQLETRLGMKEGAVVQKVESTFSQLKSLQKENEQLKIRAVQAPKASSQENSTAIEIRGVRLVVEQVAEVDPKVLRPLVDQLRDRGREKTLVLLFGNSEGRVAVCVGLTRDLVGPLDAGKIVQQLAPTIGGRGGGRPDFAQAGGTNPAGIAPAIDQLKKLLETHNPV